MARSWLVLSTNIAVLLAPVLALLALASSATAAGPYPIKSTSGARCRTAPSLTAGIVKTYAYGAPVSISCIAWGDAYAGYTLWDKTSDGCYVHDALIKTGSEKPVAKACPVKVAPPPPKTPIGPPKPCGPNSFNDCAI